MKAFAGIAVACAVAVSGAVMTAQGGGIARAPQVADGDWPNYHRDLAATRYSPLKQITTANVAQPDEGVVGVGARQRGRADRHRRRHVLPGRAAQIVAVDAATGKEVWHYDSPPPAARRLQRRRTPPGPPVANPRRAAAAREGARRRGRAQRRSRCRRSWRRWRAVARRGSGRWRRGTRTDRVDSRHGLLARRRHRWRARIRSWPATACCALDAATGKPSKGFGADGRVDGDVPYNGTPTVYRNVVIIGAATSTKCRRALPVIRARSTRAPARSSGNSRPSRSRARNSTRRGASGWKDRLAAPTCGASPASIDAERGIVYLPIAGPAANYYGGDRPGNNVYGNSIVAVDARDRPVQVALPDRASRYLGFGHAVRSARSSMSRQRPHHAGDRQGREDELHLHPRSHHRQAGVRRRGATGAEGRRADGVVFADAAVPGEAGAPLSRASTSRPSATWCGPKTRRRSTSPACEAMMEEGWRLS